MAWLRKPIRGILMDITGVLYESGERKAIEGSTEAVKMLRAANIPFRFITNETQKTREQLDSLLHRLGFDIYEKEIFMCVPAAKKFIHDLNYRPFLLVHPNVEAEFYECDQTQPNCVVMGDAANNFTYENLNQAFHVLIENNDSVLICLGKGKYYREHGELVMDVGPFAAALEKLRREPPECQAGRHCAQPKGSRRANCHDGATIQTSCSSVTVNVLICIIFYSCPIVSTSMSGPCENMPYLLYTEEAAAVAQWLWQSAC
ncbi:phospholysine phosphohistidine inorganic pyrophosphate phosphatase-like isoform X2 [Amblyomma americanum]